jgi:AraC-like DNA-binding protein
MDTRGILRPAALDRIFTLERRAPPPDLAPFVDNHWIVSWDLRGHEPYRSEVMPHPAVHLVFEPGGAAVHGIPRRRYDRVLEGRGWAVGTKFEPGGFAGFADRPVHELTGKVCGLDELFGAAGAELERRAGAGDDPGYKLDVLYAFLRARLPAEPDPRATLVNAVVADMRAAQPGISVAEFAARHHVSTRTLQRLFRRYVGVGPKWVLQRYRLHDALEQLTDRRDTDWTRFALDLGYFDHAHFISDFRAVVGQNPSQYEAAT